MCVRPPQLSAAGHVALRGELLIDDGERIKPGITG